MRDDENATVRLDDLDGAAFLLAEGCQLERVEPDETSRFHVFTLNGARAHALVNRYARGEAVVRLDAFLAARRGLLDIVHRAERVRR